MHIKYSLEDTSTTSQYYYSQLYDRIASLVEAQAESLGKQPDDLTILDVGCGRGEILQRLSERGFRNLVGIDFDAKCAELSAKHADTYVCSVSELSEHLPGRLLDIAICSHVLEHLETPRQLLLELKNLPASLLVLAVPNLGNPFKYRKRVDFENRGHVCGWDSTHLNTLLHTSGWPVIEWESDVVLLPEKLRHRLPAFVRGNIEQRILPRAHKFVFAQSLICVAQNSPES